MTFEGKDKLHRSWGKIFDLVSRTCRICNHEVKRNKEWGRAEYQCRTLWKKKKETTPKILLYIILYIWNIWFSLSAIVWMACVWFLQHCIWFFWHFCFHHSRNQKKSLEIFSKLKKKHILIWHTLLSSISIHLLFFLNVQLLFICILQTIMLSRERKTVY